jgi:hypothetical protein
MFGIILATAGGWELQLGRWEFEYVVLLPIEPWRWKARLWLLDESLIMLGFMFGYRIPLLWVDGTWCSLHIFISGFCMQASGLVELEPSLTSREPVTGAAISRPCQIALRQKWPVKKSVWPNEWCWGYLPGDREGRVRGFNFHVSLGKRQFPPIFGPLNPHSLLPWVVIIRACAGTRARPFWGQCEVSVTRARLRGNGDSEGRYTEPASSDSHVTMTCCLDMVLTWELQKDPTLTV